MEPARAALRAVKVARTVAARKPACCFNLPPLQVGASLGDVVHLRPLLLHAAL